MKKYSASFLSFKSFTSVRLSRLLVIKYTWCRIYCNYQRQCRWQLEFIDSIGMFIISSILLWLLLHLDLIQRGSRHCPVSSALASSIKSFFGGFLSAILQQEGTLEANKISRKQIIFTDRSQANRHNNWIIKRRFLKQSFIHWWFVFSTQGTTQNWNLNLLNWTLRTVCWILAC